MVFRPAWQKSSKGEIMTSQIFMLLVIVAAVWLLTKEFSTSGGSYINKLALAIGGK